MSGDARGWRMALVPDGLVNPPAKLRAELPDVMRMLEANRYRVLQLPPPGNHGLLLAVISDQVADYAHHGYAVVAIAIQGEPESLHWRRLAPLLRHRGVAPLPPRHLIRRASDVTAQERQLAAFLANYDLPMEEQRRWRA